MLTCNILYEDETEWIILFHVTGEMHVSLYDQDGQRKYLTEEERMRFFMAARAINHPADRAFCLTLLFTGCRLSEALNLTVDRVDRSDGCLIFRTLKQRKSVVYRPAAVDNIIIDDICCIIRERQLKNDTDKIWTFSRTTGWRTIKACMDRAGLRGIKATPKGLRHGFAVSCVEKGIQLFELQKLMGHERLETTRIYAIRVGKDLRDLVRRTWPAFAP